MTGYKDTLLALSSYPDVAPNYIIHQAVDIAHQLGAGVSALVQVLERKSISRSYSHSEWLVDVPGMIDNALQTSADGAKELLERFERIAKARGNFRDTLLEGTSPFPSAEKITEHARQRDLTFLPVPELIGLDELFHEAVIFGSGRPVILIPAVAERGAVSHAIDRVVVAWDFGRASSRALADAMPILKAAEDVHIVTFFGEKSIPGHLAIGDLDRHLRTHGIHATFDTVDVEGQPIGKSIEVYVAKHKANLLVMGAFGHSRMMEFVLGGATRSILTAPPIPVFLSH
ncbi:MAG: universal stress protein [Proteobacteria bacterium]|nr:universal stress protein [Pseudomonadota bacterium]